VRKFPTQKPRNCRSKPRNSGDHANVSQVRYDNLLAKAAAVHRLPFTKSAPESHVAASKLMVDEADELYAVWDGKPARAYCGTADVVAYAREHGIPVRVIWPAGAQRDESQVAAVSSSPSSENHCIHGPGCGARRAIGVTVSAIWWTTSTCTAS
jgi:hypothetical protein